MIFKIFSPKNLAKKLAFLTQNKVLVFKKNANFFAENWEKLQKIVIITSTPACSVVQKIVYWGQCLYFSVQTQKTMHKK
jgi:hypothetical protein